MADLVVAGAGMAGLVAAVEARSRGANVVVYEKGDRPGGSMLLSSGVVWRHRDFDDFRRECPGGDPELQRLVHERLDEDLDWLRGLGVEVRSEGTGNPHTTGVHFDTRSLSEELAVRAGHVRLGTPLRVLPDAAPTVLATGGFQSDRELVREHITSEAQALLLRATPWSTGDGLRLGLQAGGSASAGLHEFYGRAMPAPPARVPESGFVQLAQPYARYAEVVGAAGARYEATSWSEIDVVQWMAHQPGARATFRIPVSRLGERIRERTIGELVAAAELAGADVARRNGVVAVEVVAGITTTLGGLQVDPTGHVAGRVWSAGGDVGGIATGGYASGLAAALVLGRVAAVAALEAR
jgi:fumarate reductase flavoprotein subunit